MLLGRALLHAKLVAERNHARREEFVVDAQAGTHLADAIDPARRRKLETAFRRLRRDGADPSSRADLVEGIAPMIETP